MITIGITGIIGSGKTTVSAILKNKGLIVIDLDALAKKALLLPEVLQDIEKNLGKDFTGSKESLVAKLRNTVFTTGEKLAELEKIVHPRIRRMLLEEIEKAKKKEEPSILIDGPLIYEKGLDKELDKVVVVSASMDRIKERLLERGMLPGDIERRIARQIPLEEKEEKADFILYNNGTKKDLEGETDMLLSRIKEWEVRGNAS